MAGMKGPGVEDGGARRPARLLAFLALLLLGVGVTVSLGNWQVARRAWKLDLIERVETRVHAPAVPAPGPAAWPGVSTASDEYRHVRLSGRFLPGRGTLVAGTTALGGGFWLLEPFRVDEGWLVLVNRGFVPGERSTAERTATPPPAAEEEIVGLLRITEPGGGFLRANDPAGGWWYSRDVAAIAAARGLEGPVAPYFVDAEVSSDPRPPVGGLTVIAFRNTHLIYALTWYGLALMLAGATCFLLLSEWRARRGRA
ncbi:SURF1 family protein [Pararoseomonas indoligenes]|uniref:SURF1-like protein n=1 Tax=Roseomonas indoligenes TaxID=2820811 RepID=A0A940MZS1_9PROT|nr:SURF1 family protein [Pararoseomonas indoligenes]MBP0494162.1 SURF1 family protein [Pararoseomonas indoligenes]